MDYNKIIIYKYDHDPHRGEDNQWRILLDKIHIDHLNNTCTIHPYTTMYPMRLPWMNKIEFKWMSYIINMIMTDTEAKIISDVFYR